MYRRILTALLITLTLAGCSALPTLPPLPFGLLGKVQQPCSGLSVGLLIADETANTIASEQNDGYALALQEINAGSTAASASSGINGCKVSLVKAVEPSDDNPTQTRDAIRSLVDNSKVIAILGGTTSTASAQAASLINFLKVPFLIPSAGGSHVLPADNLWAFRLQASETTYAQTTFEMVKQALGMDASVAIIYEDTTEGHDAAVAAVNAIEAQGMNVAGYFPLPAGTINTATYQNLATQIIKLQPNVIYYIFSQSEQSTNIYANMNTSLKGGEQAYTPSFTIVRAGGFTTRAFLFDDSGNIKPVDEDLILATQWIGGSDTQAGKQLYQAFADYTRAKYGQTRTPSLYAVEAYKSLQILAAAARRVLATGKASPTDIANLRSALREELFAYQENSPFWGTISFAAGGQNPGEVVLVQVLNRQLVPVYPQAKANQTPVPAATPVPTTIPTPTPTPQ